MSLEGVGEQAARTFVANKPDRGTPAGKKALDAIISIKDQGGNNTLDDRANEFVKQQELAAVADDLNNALGDGIVDNDPFAVGPETTSIANGFNEEEINARG